MQQHQEKERNLGVETGEERTVGTKRKLEGTALTLLTVWLRCVCAGSHSALEIGVVVLPAWLCNGLHTTWDYKPLGGSLPFLPPFSPSVIAFVTLPSFSGLCFVDQLRMCFVMQTLNANRLHVFFLRIITCMVLRTEHLTSLEGFKQERCQSRGG